MKIHHIGYLVKDIKRAQVEFEKLGFLVTTEVTHDTIRHIDILFMEKDSYCIELIAPYDETSLVAGLIKKYKGMPYHIGYLTEAFDTDLAKYQAEGFTLMGEPCPAPAFSGKRVSFLMNAKIGIMELIEQYTGDET